ncbi:MAG: serine/threonine-protein kinase [Balneolaceae bacterium]
MGKVSWDEVQTAIEEVLDLPEEEQIPYIEKKYQNSEELKFEVTQLLQSILESEEWLENPEDYKSGLFVASPEDSQPSAMIGEKIGHYRIKKLVGHGGMGSVFLAERDDGNFEQSVALKLIRREMATPSNIARFRREQQILADLSHSNIARLYDGGLTADGLPWLVMEFIEGIPVTSYCDEKKLPIQDRIHLFKQISRAVQYAHSNLVIHRDLKPDNILVTKEGQVKVLDFGIARLLDADPGDLIQTREGSRMLTLRYAAPEQVSGKKLTTTVDIYTLGTLLYQLTAGVHPFDLNEKERAEVESIIKTTAAPHPAKRFTALPADQQQELSVKRSARANEISVVLRSDLASIFLKALRKEPDSRYESAGELLEDLNRFEQNLPVTASDGTIRYHLGKFAKRHKAGITTAAAFILVFISFGFFYTWQITSEGNQAKQEAQKAEEVSAFLTDLFEASDPMYEADNIPSALDLLERGEERIHELNDQPASQAQLLGVIGRSLSSLARYDKAEDLLNRSSDLRQQIYPPDHPEIAEGLGNLAVLQRKKGNFAAAESLHTKALEIRQKSLGKIHDKTAESLNDLGVVLSTQRKFEASDSVFKAASEIYNNLYGPDYHEIARSLSNQASNQRALANYMEAEALYQEAYDIWKSQFDPNHPNIAESIHDLALVKGLQGNVEEADSLYRISLKIYKDIFEEPHPRIAQNMDNLGVLLGKNGYYKESLPYLEGALEMFQSLYKDSHPQIAGSLNNLGRLNIEMGNYEEAKLLLNKALEIDIGKYGYSHPYVGGDLRNLGLISKSQENYPEAEGYFRKSLSIFEDELPENHTFVTETLTNLGEVLIFNNKPGEAEEVLVRLLEILEEERDQAQISQAKILLGIAHFDLEKYRNSELLLTAGYETLKDEDNEYTNKARQYLDRLYEITEEPEKARSLDSVHE